MKNSFRQAMTNVDFKCHGIRYVQSDDLIMGATVAVMLVSVWMKSFEASLQEPELNGKISKSDQNGNCKDCNRRVTFRVKEV